MNSEPSYQELDKKVLPTGKLRWVFMCIGIVTIGAIILVLMSLLKSEPELVTPTNRVPVLDAELIELKQGHFEIRSSGRVEPAERVQLQAQVSGDVVSVSENMKSGAYFEKGDVLLSINPIRFEARLGELLAQQKSAQAEERLASRQLQRTEELLQANATSREELDQRQVANLTAKARIEEIAANIISARLDLDKTKIKAPFAGRVVSESVSIGDVLTPGSSFAEIYSSEYFELTVALRVSDAVLLENSFAPRSQTKTKTQIKVEAEFAGNRFSWPGYLDRVETGLDTATRTVDFIVRVKNPEQSGTLIEAAKQSSFISTAPPLLPNMFVTAIIPTTRIEQYVEVARDAVRADGSLWLVQTDQSGIGEIFIVKADLLSTQRKSAFLHLPEIDSHTTNNNALFILGSDIGAALPGSQVRIRNAAQKLGQSNGLQTNILNGNLGLGKSSNAEIETAQYNQSPPDNKAALTPAIPGLPSSDEVEK